MENQKGKPMTMEEKQQLMRERLGRNIGKMYEKPAEITPNETLEVATKPVDKPINKVVKGKEKVLETNKISRQIRRWRSLGVKQAIESCLSCH